MLVDQPWHHLLEVSFGRQLGGVAELLDALGQAGVAENHAESLQVAVQPTLVCRDANGFDDLGVAARVGDIGGVRWSGGLDFAILCEIRNGTLQVIATGTDDREILQGLNRLPGLHTDLKGKHTVTDVAEQKRIWTDLALSVFGKWPTLNEWLYPSRHGKNVAVTFDLRYGAIFAEMVEEEPAPPGGDSIGIFLFAVAMNQYEVNNFTAMRHFANLSGAVRHIRTGVMKG